MTNPKRFLGRNLFMLKGRYARRGYDWWWHSFTGINAITGEEKAFFIEYFAINPSLYPTKVVLGQRSDNQTYGIRPSYVMIKAGAWGKDAVQINNFYPAKELVYKRNKLDFQVGSCILSEHTISGAVSVDKEEALRYPECMTDSGSMSWNLQINKKIPYCVGYGTNWFFRVFHFFQMYWHAQGVKTEYTGKVTLNGSVYNVMPETCYGYADKNWGSDFTNPWVWLSSCDMTNLITGKRLENSCFELGGGTPRILGIPIKGKVLTYIKLENEEFEFNFSKFWKKSSTRYTFFDEGDEVHWSVSAQNRNYLVDINVFCNKSEMIKVNYENPDGQKLHNNLWNGGNGHGDIKIFKKIGSKDLEVYEHISIGHVGCEYGEYEEK